MGCWGWWGWQASGTALSWSTGARCCLDLCLYFVDARLVQLPAGSFGVERGEACEQAALRTHVHQEHMCWFLLYAVGDPKALPS